jgi:hypothetical protein
MEKRKELEAKPWYRFVKVLYILSYAVVLLFTVFVVYGQYKPYTSVDESKTWITCNYGNRRTFTAKQANIYIMSNFLETKTLPNRDRTRIQELCGISQQEVQTSLNALYEGTGGEKALFDISPSSTSYGSWGEFSKNLVIGLGIVFLIFEGIKRAFLYIVTGRATLEK